MMNSTIHYGLPQVPALRAPRIREIFGDDTILIPTEWGTKKPMQKGYTNFTLEKMSDPQHLALLERKNIAILTGAKSGNLISVDFDDDAAYQQFRACNPQLCSTVMTRASRGCNLWYRLKGQYPEGVSKLVNESGMEIGEWRAGNGITIVDGLHPSGVRYEVSSPGGVLEVSFDQIKWPEDWNKVPGRVDPFDVLAEEYGPPVL
ncbi:MAG: bifunctional DNA primase/polymerase, partial [Verrucomicrobiae bacterium]|nr:bifunctional DNA primase/polymerase [Verrucomicrobiae bacterium]